MKSIFPQGFKGLSDTVFSGVAGSVFRCVGFDFRGEPGKIKVHQKLSKVSGVIVDTLCKHPVRISDTLRLWFGGSKGFLDNAGTFSEKLELTKFSDRDLMFASPTFGFTGDPSSVVRISDDGMVLFVLSISGGTLKQYALSQAFDLSDPTLTFTWSVSAKSFHIEEDRVFILNSDQIDVYRIVSWNVTEAKLASEWDISAQLSDAIDIGFSEDGTDMFVLGADGTIYEYSLASAFGGVLPAFRMLLVAGGGSGGSVDNYSNADTGRYKRAGSGGAGNAAEFTDEALLPGVTYNISTGTGGAAPAGGTNNGVVGSDTVSFGKTAKGGGYGAAMNTETFGSTLLVNAGGEGGSGGGGSYMTSSGDSARGLGGAISNLSTLIAGGEPGTSGLGGSTDDGKGGGISLVSDISGSDVTYSPPQPSRSTQGDGVAGSSIGQGGSGARTGTSAANRPGGAGADGITILRFKTADVSYSHTGGSVTTSGSDTIITWTGAGTFSYTLTGPSFVDDFAFPVSRGFAIESGRLALIVGDQISQYTLTGYDLSTAALFENALRVWTATETVTARSIQLLEDYFLIGYETGAEDDLLTASLYEFIGGGTEILSAHAFTVKKTEEARRQAFIDSVGVTESVGASGVAYGIQDDTARSFNTVTPTEIPIAASYISAEVCYARAYNSSDVSKSVRGVTTGRTSSTVTIRPNTFPSMGISDANFGTVGGLKTLDYDSVVSDAIIMDDSLNVGGAGSNARSVVIQPFTVARAKDIDAIEIKYREGFDLNGGYDLVMELKDSDGVIVATDTVTVTDGDIGHTESIVRFTFTAMTLAPGTRYTIETYIDNVSALDFDLSENRYLVCPVKTRDTFPFDTTVTFGGTVEIQARLIDTSIEETDEEDVYEDRVYFATEKMLFYILASDITGSWAGKIVTVGAFSKGSTADHPMAVQNLGLFIGDGSLIAKVQQNGVFVQETDLNVESDEVITVLEPFDVDLLIGTRWRNFGRVLRWDTESDSWSGQDSVFDKGGVRAFLPDDNYVYVFAGEKGVMYFYNGEKNELSQRIPGVLSGSVIVNRNAVGFLNNIPLFGLSNVSGNTVLQGVYGFGKYAPGYQVAMSLDFPVPTDEFTNVQIGSILVDGIDAWVSWQDGSDVGIAKVDYTAKYAGAYLETRVLTQGELRPQLKTLADVHVPYVELPSGTGITIGVKKAYEVSYTDKTVTDDPKRLAVRLKNPSVPNVASLQLRIGATVSGNDAPEMEDVLYDIPVSAEK